MIDQEVIVTKPLRFRSLKLEPMALNITQREGARSCEFSYNPSMFWDSWILTEPRNCRDTWNFTKPLISRNLCKLHTFLPLVQNRLNLEIQVFSISVYHVSRTASKLFVSLFYYHSGICRLFYPPLPKFSGPLTALPLDSVSMIAWPGNTTFPKTTFAFQIRYLSCIWMTCIRITYITRTCICYIKLGTLVWFDQFLVKLRPQ